MRNYLFMLIPFFRRREMAYDLYQSYYRVNGMIMLFLLTTQIITYAFIACVVFGIEFEMMPITYIIYLMVETIRNFALCESEQDNIHNEKTHLNNLKK